MINRKKTAKPKQTLCNFPPSFAKQVNTPESSKPFQKAFDI